MNKKTLLLFLINLLLFTNLNIKIAKADTYPISCNYYELSYINDDGSFSKKECYDNFDEANKKMKELGDDYVVRSVTSYSPTKIISMNKGYVYSYPGRENEDVSTLNIYEDISIRDIYHKQTYVSSYYQIFYQETSRVLKDGKRGMLKVSLNGFDGYTDLEFTDLVPMKFIEKRIPIYLGGNNLHFKEDPYRVILDEDYYEVKTNGNYKDLIFNYHLAYPSKNSDQALTYSIVAGVAPDFMEENKRYYSSDGINFYFDSELKDKAGEYLNYYQWLPLRSKTNIYAAQLETFLKQSGRYDKSIMKEQAQTFIDAQNKYGINALLVYAMALHESAYGTSNLAIKKNNLFGWRAFDSSPNSATSFQSVSHCINEQMGINLRGFIDITDGRFFGSSIGNKGAGLNVKYASDPYWGIKIASYAYKIDKTANNYNGKLSDYDKYEFKLIKTFDTNIYLEPNNSKVLYTTGYGGNYQKGFYVIVLDEVGEYTKIQSTNAIKDGKILTHKTPITNGKTNPLFDYDFNESVAYIKTSDLLIEDLPDEKDYQVMRAIDVISLNKNKIDINGIALFKELNLSNEKDIKYSLILKDYLDEDNYLETEIATVKNEGFNLNDGYDYSYSGFKGSIDFSSLKEGRYGLYLRMKTNKLDKIVELRSSNQDYAYAHYKENDNYILKSEYSYNYRFTLEILSSPLDYSLLNKPSNRDSFATFDKFELNDKGELRIDGIGIIYYVDFDKDADIEYKLYLINSDTNYLAFNDASNSCKYNFNEIYKSKYDFSRICFDATASLSTLKPGNYDLMMIIKNGEYYDIVPVTNRSFLDLEHKIIDKKEYCFYTNDALGSIHLEIKEVSE